MDFGLTDEQDLLRATARQFVADVCPAEKAKRWDEEGIVPPELFRGMADLGWFSLPFSEEEGGDGGGPLELVLIAEELGRASFDVAMCYIGVLIPGITVFRWGDEAQRTFIREQVMTGRHRLAVGLSEPDSGSDAAALRTTAEDHGDQFLVRGQKAWCTGGGLPDTTIATYVRTGPREPKHGGISLLLVDPATDGVEVRRTPTLARHILGTNEVFFNDALVPKENLVGPRDEGWKVMLSNIELEKVIITGGISVPRRPRWTRCWSTPAPGTPSAVRSGTSRPSPTTWPICRPRSTPPGCSRTARPGCSPRASRARGRARWPS